MNLQSTFALTQAQKQVQDKRLRRYILKKAFRVYQPYLYFQQKMAVPQTLDESEQ
ncbi:MULTISPECIES: hypothetical protein [Paenibacillus]|uniref:hypothetical protein n=1 Tax=Paenibacillus TaxID=44249 RepID=UPI0022B8CDDB|nr:hypothetical protein [Paenibacillus caseinilyticus]MCZ8522452.1 hypothetical protein [Paenibacillus caseinilyticus]